jgi:thymidylate kinase
MRRVILLAGPDGTGKSTAAQLAADTLRARGITVTTGHYRSGILYPRSDEATTEPHRDPPRSAPMAASKLLVLFADFALGYLGPWRRTAANGVVLLERGWWDHEADPVRYRLPMNVRWLTHALGRALPRADVAVLLVGDARAIVERKPELDTAEVERQIARWRSIVDKAAHHSIEIDTTSADAGEVAQRIATIASRPQWVRLPASPARNDVRATGGRAGARAAKIYRPTSRTARLVTPWSRRLGRWGLGRHVEPPVPALGELFALAGVDDVVGLAAMRSPGRTRWVVGASNDAELVAVAKVGDGDDLALRHELELLQELRELPVSTPQLLYGGRWGEHVVIVTGAVAHHGPPVTADEALTIALALADVRGRFLVHGDLAPWNVIRDQQGSLVLLDFEHAAWERRPMFDLTHFVVQSGALLKAYPPADAAEILCRPGGLGDRYLESVETSAPAERLVGDYIAERRDRDDASPRELAYLRELGALI